MLTILFITFFVLLLINMPIAFALGIATAVTLLADPVLPINSIVTRAFVGVDSLTLVGSPNESWPLPDRWSGSFAAGSRMYRLCPACFLRAYPVQRPLMHLRSVP